MSQQNSIVFYKIVGLPPNEPSPTFLYSPYWRNQKKWKIDIDMVVVSHKIFIKLYYNLLKKYKNNFKTYIWHHFKSKHNNPVFSSPSFCCFFYYVYQKLNINSLYPVFISWFCLYDIYIWCWGRNRKPEMLWIHYVLQRIWKE